MKHSTSPWRSLVVGAALFGAAGAAAAVASAATSPHVSTSQASTLPANRQQIAVAPRPLSAAPANAPARATSQTAGPVTPAQATIIAERQGRGRATKLETETDTAGTTYEVKVVRPGGVEAKVVVAANTGRVLRMDVETETQDESGDQDRPDPADAAEPGQDTGEE